MIATRSTKSGLPCYPAKIDAQQNCWDTSTVIQLKCWGYAMLNFSGHRVRANYSVEEGGRTRLIPGHPLKRVRANLYTAERFFFVAERVHVSVRTADFSVAPTTRTITRLRYVRLRGVTRVVFPFAHVSVFPPQHFQYFEREFVSDMNSNKVIRTKISAVRMCCLSTWYRRKFV